MKIQLMKHDVWVVILVLVVAACSPANPQADAGSYSAPQAWFDAPLPGSVFPLGEVQVLAHAADKSGLSEMELSLMDGPMIGSQSAGQGETLAAASFNWHPPEPGHYVLAFRAMNTSGDWSEYAYTDVEISGDETPEPQEPASEEPAPTEETVQPTDTSAPEACTDLASFVSETVLDDTVFKPGVAFTKTWTLKNVGTCTWTTRYALSFYDGEQMGGSSMIPLSKEVQPGDTITLSVDLTAPNQTGKYKGRWMLMNAEGVLFGLGDSGNVAFWVQIIVQTKDTQAPSVDVSYAPNGRGEPTGRQKITFSAEASDNVKVTKIEIYLMKAGGNWQLMETCNNQDTCSIQVGPLNTGDYRLRAYAYDAAGNQGNSGVVNFSVIP